LKKTSKAESSRIELMMKYVNNGTIDPPNITYYIKGEILLTQQEAPSTASLLNPVILFT
jgi:hypothetical protein